MFVGPIISKGVDEFLFEQFLDPLLPTLPLGIPTPLPARFVLASVDAQISAGNAIAEGKVAGTNQYTGQIAAADNARSLGYNLMYQPGGMKI